MAQGLILTKMMDNLYLDKLKGRITDDEYDKFFQSFHEQKADITTRLGMLQEAEDNYYITAKYLLELANRAYELFKSSEVEERRQLIKLVLSNLRVEDKIVRYEAIKPFDTILNYAERQAWLPRVGSNHGHPPYKCPQLSLRLGLSHPPKGRSGI